MSSSGGSLQICGTFTGRDIFREAKFLHQITFRATQFHRWFFVDSCASVSYRWILIRSLDHLASDPHTAEVGNRRCTPINADRNVRVHRRSSAVSNSQTALLSTMALVRNLTSL